MPSEQPGRLVIISGPSGAGKSTVVRRLLDECSLPLVLSVSATTRQPRPGEIDGQHYHFLENDEFDRLRAADELLESAEVFGRGHWYGTLRSEVTSGLTKGNWVILEIDVEGAVSVMQQPDLNPISLFIHPGGLEQLENRLRARQTETEEAITRRLEVAVNEMSMMHHYRHEVINDSVDRVTNEICEILKSYEEHSTCSKS